VIRFTVFVVRRFLTDRGTQLAAMIAYYALISFVPLTFLGLAAFGLFQAPDEESALVERLQEILPGAPIEDIVASLEAVQGASRTFGVIGGALLLWSALALFGALQTAFNVVYRRPHRSFLHGRGIGVAMLFLAITAGVVLFLTVSVVAGVVGQLLPEGSGSLLGFGISLASGVGGTFVVLALAYYTLTNARLTVREVLPGAALGAAAIQVSFQVVPLFLHFTSDSLAVQMLGSTALLLLWFYVLAAIVVFCHELNWCISRRSTAEEDA
jgi:membrane protein